MYDIGIDPHIMPTEYFSVDGSDVVEHIFVRLSQRKVTILDREGFEETVKYNWDEEGSEGFQETIAMFQATVPKDIITYVP